MPAAFNPHALSPGSSQRLAAVQRARHRLLSEGPGAALSGVEPWIAASWQRCLAAGREPHQPVVFQPISLQAQRRVLDVNHDLRGAAQPSMQVLGGLVAGIGYFALLTDRSGIVIDVAGQIDRADPAAATIAQVGVDLSESAAGTSAICTALSEQHPVWLHQSEHYFETTGVYSCAGAPVFDPLGRCIGMLDLTGIRVREQRQLIHLVTRYAQEIGRALLLRQPMALLLRISWPGTAGLGSLPETGLISVDQDGAVIGADQVARHMVPELDRLAGPGLHLSELFATPWQTVHDLARQDLPLRELPLWSGLSLQVQAQAARDLDAGALESLRQGHTAAAPAPARSLKAMQAALIEQAVLDARGNIELAAKRLGISRATLYRKLQSRH